MQTSRGTRWHSLLTWRLQRPRLQKPSHRCSGDLEPQPLMIPTTPRHVICAWTALCTCVIPAHPILCMQRIHDNLCDWPYPLHIACESDKCCKTLCFVEVDSGCKGCDRNVIVPTPVQMQSAVDRSIIPSVVNTQLLNPLTQTGDASAKVWLTIQSLNSQYIFTFRRRYGMTRISLYRRT